MADSGTPLDQVENIKAELESMAAAKDPRLSDYWDIISELSITPEQLFVRY